LQSYYEESLTGNSSNKDSSFYLGKSLDFDPLKLRSDLALKFPYEWEEIANLKELVDSMEIESYHLTGSLNSPIVKSYVISSQE
jgi:hypothetical protein